MDRQIRVNFSAAMEDYTMQQTDVTFTTDTQIGDIQCIGVDIIDNDKPDNERYFFIHLTSFLPLVRVVPGFETTIVTILDNDGRNILCMLKEQDLSFLVYNIQHVSQHLK